MKKILLFCCTLSLLSCTDVKTDQIAISTNKSITELTANFWHVVQLQNHEISLKSRTSIENIQGMCAMLFVIMIVLLIVLTPIVLVYNWATNFYEYIRKYKKMELGTHDPETALIKWQEYRRIYSDMSGFGYGLLAYILSAYGYMFLFFDKISEGFLFYVNFPFKVYNNLSQAINPTMTLVSADVWVQMLIIIGISLIAFILGKTFGFYVVNKRYEKPVLSNAE